jgi:hypothetical protein
MGKISKLEIYGVLQIVEIENRAGLRKLRRDNSNLGFFQQIWDTEVFESRGMYLEGLLIWEGGLFYMTWLITLSISSQVRKCPEFLSDSTSDATIHEACTTQPISYQQTGNKSAP